MSLKALSWAMELDLPGIEKLVLLCLADYADRNNNTCYPSQTTLAKKAGVGLATVKRALKSLIEKGLIRATSRRREDGSKTSNLYQLSIEYTGTSVNTSVSQGTMDSSERAGGQLREIQGSAQSELSRTSQMNQSEESNKDSFEELWKVYPKRSGGNPKKLAFKAYQARLQEKHTHEELMKAVEAYASYCRKDKKTGTSYVLQAATFLGPNERWKEFTNYESAIHAEFVPRPKQTPEEMAAEAKKREEDERRRRENRAKIREMLKQTEENLTT